MTAQWDVVATLVEHARNDECVAEVLVRGSLAKGTVDDASDTDVILVVPDGCFGAFLAGLDRAVDDRFELLHPEGWVDALVPDFGGLGLVYFLAWEGRMRQLDLYVLPTGRRARLEGLPAKRTVFGPRDVETGTDGGAVDALIDGRLRAADGHADVVLEAVVTLMVLSKQVYRGLPLLAARYRYAATAVVVRLARTLWTPNRVDYGCYDWDADLTGLLPPELEAFARGAAKVDALSAQELFDVIALVTQLVAKSPLARELPWALPLLEELRRTVVALLGDARLAGSAWP